MGHLADVLAGSGDGPPGNKDEPRYRNGHTACSPLKAITTGQRKDRNHEEHEEENQHKDVRLACG